MNTRTSRIKTNFFFDFVAFQAANRRELAAGDANTLFSVAVEESGDTSDTTTAGWGSQSGARIPPHLQDRLTSLKKEHQPKPHAERQVRVL